MAGIGKLAYLLLSLGFSVPVTQISQVPTRLMAATVKLGTLICNGSWVVCRLHGHGTAIKSYLCNKKEGQKTKNCLPVARVDV